MSRPEFMLLNMCFLPWRITEDDIERRELGILMKNVLNVVFVERVLNDGLPRSPDYCLLRNPKSLTRHAAVQQRPLQRR